MQAIKNFLDKAWSGRMRFWVPAVLFLLALWACQLSQNPKVDDTADFDPLYDSLARFDSVIIVFNDPQGMLLDTVFQGKVDSHSKIRNLEVKGWDGGKAQIMISGFNAGQLVYQVNKKYDGTSDETDANIVLVVPDAAITSDIHELLMAAGDSLKYPPITVGPAVLSDKSVLWSSSDPGVLAAGSDGVKALKAGAVVLKAQLKSSPAVQLAFNVVVSPSGRAPESLAFESDTLYLAAGGAPRALAVKAVPSTASNAVIWSVEENGIAKVDSNGNVSGLSKGTTKLIATSKEASSLSISAVIVVSDPVSVENVRFAKNPVTIYVGGTAEILTVEVSPSQAIQNVSMSVLDPTKAVLDGNALKAITAGTTQVVAKSLADSNKTDTLSVTVLDPGKIDSLRIAPRSNQQMYYGAPSVALSGQVFPASAPQAIAWKSSDPSVAGVSETGLVTAIESGTAWIFASSRADSSKRDSVSFTIKRDIPRIAFGNDTSLALGDTLVVDPQVSQDFGGIAVFKWDVDGNTGWDDSSSSVKSLTFAPTLEKDYLLKVYVRDTEGNEAIATRKISVRKGPAIAIVSPADNSYTNQIAITVKWTVDGQVQDTLPKESLKLGANTITRTAKDSSGRQGSASIVVYLDTLKPLAPVLTGPASTSLPPVWHWATGGGGGSGDFRFKMGDADFSQGATLSRDTSFSLNDGLASGTTYTLFVEERDQAGNWSDAAKLGIKYDLTKPTVTVASPTFTGGTLYTNSASVNLSGTVTGPSPISSMAYAIGNGSALPISLSAGAWVITGIPVSEGVTANVTITATDSVGNIGSLVVPILMDNTPPAAPAFVIMPTTPTKAISGSWTWKAGADGANGSGLNGHFRYALNSGAWKDTTGLDASSLVLSEGNNVLALQEQDRAGLWSTSATSLVKLDLTAPSLSILGHSNPANITSTHFTFTVSAGDSGSGVQSVTVTGQTAGNGSMTSSGGTWTSADLTLKGGANSLVITATDQVGNYRNLTFTVNVNVPASVVKITDPADNNTLTNADSIDISFTIDGTPGKKRFGLSEGANILTISSAPNASGAIGKDSVKVMRDATSPNAPSVSVIAANTNGTGTWTWSSNGDNVGGAGVKTQHAYRYSFNGGATWASTTLNSVSQTAEGVYTLIAQEQDLAGNWSVSSEPKTISVDKTAPVVTIQTPDNYITNLDSVKISYTEQDSTKPSVAKTKWVKLPTDHGANTVTISSTADAAGNIGTASITVYRRSEVVFVKASASGSGDGSSWDNAAGGLESGIAKAGDGGQIWLAAGTYKPNSASGFVINNAISIFGGFSSSGNSYSVVQRDSTVPYKTTLSSGGFSNDTLVNVKGKYDNFIPGFTLNSLQMSGYGITGLRMEYVSDFNIVNCIMQQFDLAIEVEVGSGTFANCTIQQNTAYTNNRVVALDANWKDPNGILFQNCTFQNNYISNGSGMIIYATNFTNLIFQSCSLIDSSIQNTEDAYHLQTNDPFAEAVVTFKGSTVLGGLSKIFHGGTLNYVGLGNTPPN